uniref:cytospin-A-like isoform X2 n=1 Tax=Myxine glutinosa TaxID=7769 RepID=UPI00358E916D
MGNAGTAGHRSEEGPRGEQNKQSQRGSTASPTSKERMFNFGIVKKRRSKDGFHTRTRYRPNLFLRSGAITRSRSEGFLNELAFQEAKLKVLEDQNQKKNSEIQKLHEQFQVNARLSSGQDNGVEAPNRMEMASSGKEEDESQYNARMMGEEEEFEVAKKMVQPGQKDHQELEENYKNLEQRLQRLSEENMELKETLQAFEQWKDRALLKGNDMETELDMLREKLDQSMAETQTMQSCISEVAAENEVLKTQLSANESDSVTKGVERNIGQRHAGNVQRGCEAEAMHLQTELRLRDEQLAELCENVLELEDALEQHRMVKLHDDHNVAEHLGTINSLEEENRNLHTQLRDSKLEMQEAQSEWKQFQSDLQTAVVLADNLRDEAEEATGELREELQEARRIVGQLEAELSAGLTASDEADSRTPSFVKPIEKDFAEVLAPVPANHNRPSSILQHRCLNQTKDEHVERRNGGVVDMSDPSVGFLNGASIPNSQPACSADPTSVTRQSRLRDGAEDPLIRLSKQYNSSKRNALLLWCQKQTKKYRNIDITNFSSSWSDGLAFCALVHSYLPAHIPYSQLNPTDKRRNFSLAFDAAESIGIPPTLNIEELLQNECPDWHDVKHYVTSIYTYFET